MPNCPICQTEYQQGLSCCADCGEPLVEEVEFHHDPDMSGEDTEGQWSLEDFPPDIDTVLLCSLSDDVTANMILAALHEQGIPAVIIARGAGHFLPTCVSYSFSDRDIFVPVQLKDEAREVQLAIMREYGK